MTARLLQHFGFHTHPFSRATSKEALFRHPGFVEALERLRFTVELDSLAALAAESGCGKSLLLGVLSDELQQQGMTVHYLAHSTIGPFGLVNVLARKAGLAPRRSRGETAAELSRTLLADERKHFLVIDEAHQLSDDTLEDLRLLTIADFDRKSPFLLLLAGKPGLDDRLAEPIHHAFDQRITTLARLLPLTADETREYLRHRLAAAGSADRPVFEDSAMAAIHDASNGVPRRINNLATSALAVAATRKRRIATAQDVQDARIDRGRQ